MSPKINTDWKKKDLALYGGKPVRKELLPYGHQWLGREEIKKVTEVLKSDWITTGPVVKEFETEFARSVGAKYAVSVNSGTAALHIACLALGLKPGEEVITTPMTFVATANSVLYCGGKPVFVDLQEDTLNMDPKNIEKSITAKTRGILPVHFAGHPCDMDEIHRIAKKHGLWVLEDAAHALSAKYKGRKIGGISDATIFSFHPVKNITTGEGGMVTTNSKKIYETLLMYRTHGIKYDVWARRNSNKSWLYDMQLLGFRFNMTELQAAIGLCQLQKLKAFQQQRENIVQAYHQAFSHLPEWILPVKRLYIHHSWHLYVLRLSRNFQSHVERDTLMQALRAENIGVNLHYRPVYAHTYYQKKFSISKKKYPVCEEQFKRMLTLPLFPRMKGKDSVNVIEAVEKVTHAFRKK